MAEQKRRVARPKRFVDAERRRGLVLAFLRASGGATPPEVSKLLDTMPQRTAQLLTRMVKLNEVRFVEGAGRRRDGQPCRMYYAVAESTVSAGEILRKLGENLNGPSDTPAPAQAPTEGMPKTIFGGLILCE